jgi:protein-S-isoprenylcysteine O-methyltransferase Ste14
MNTPEEDPRVLLTGAGTGSDGRNVRPRVPPLVLMAASALLMWGGARLAPNQKRRQRHAQALAMLIASFGFAIALAGVLAFRQHRTTVDPTRPEQASVLVTTGPYAVTRNPMYLGMLLVLV